MSTDYAHLQRVLRIRDPSAWRTDPDTSTSTHSDTTRGIIGPNGIYLFISTYTRYIWTLYNAQHRIIAQYNRTAFDPSNPEDVCVDAALEDLWSSQRHQGALDHARDVLHLHLLQHNFQAGVWAWSGESDLVNISTFEEHTIDLDTIPHVVQAFPPYIPGFLGSDCIHLGCWEGTHVYPTPHTLYPTAGLGWASAAFGRVYVDIPDSAHARLALYRQISERISKWPGLAKGSDGT